MAKARGRETVSDMVRSLSVVGVVVAALFLVVVWQRPEGLGPDVRRGPDVPGVVEAVAISGPFEPLVPASLPSGWEATSAWFQASDPEVDGAVLHLGYLTPDGSYAELRQTDGELDDVLVEWVGEAAEPDGSVTLGSLTWRRYAAPDRLALVTEPAAPDAPPVAVVTGKAGWAELEELAASVG